MLQGKGHQIDFFNHILLLSKCSLCLNEREGGRFLPVVVLSKISGGHIECSEMKGKYILKTPFFRFKTINCLTVVA